jgi:hypothetical protein
MRAAIAPMLNGAFRRRRFLAYSGHDDFRLAPMFAGLTVGHMIALGKMKQQDKARATKVVTVAFRSAIILGEREAREAMLKQRDCEGSA